MDCERLASRWPTKKAASPRNRPRLSPIPRNEHLAPGYQGVAVSGPQHTLVVSRSLFTRTDEVLLIVSSSSSLVFRNLRVRAQGPCTVDSTVARVRRKNVIRGLPFLGPLF